MKKKQVYLILLSDPDRGGIKTRCESRAKLSAHATTVNAASGEVPNTARGVADTIAEKSIETPFRDITFRIDISSIYRIVILRYNHQNRK